MFYFKKTYVDEDCCFYSSLMIIWLIQVKDGKLLDEVAVSMTGLASKVGWADICHAVQRQNQSPERGTVTLIQNVSGHAWASYCRYV